jgi:hypothetical protein
MRTIGNASNYTRHTYKVSSELKNYTVYHLTDVNNGINLLTEILRIEKFQHKSKATNIRDYLRLRNTSNWANCEMVTGLRPTHIKGLYYGDRRKQNKTRPGKKTLLMFLFAPDRSTLIIDVYKGYYPNNRGFLENIINSY